MGARAGKLAIIGIVALCAAACGPVQYISQVTRGAASELAAAKSAGAEKYAPYEYTSAVEYLHKAREEEGFSDHQAAIRFGKKAEEMAKKARQIALDSAGTEPSARPGEAPIDPSASPAAPSKHGDQE